MKTLPVNTMSWRPLSLLLFCLFAPAWSGTAVAQGPTQWAGNALQLELGTVISRDKGITLQADANGQIYFKLPTEGLRFEQFPLLDIRLTSPNPAATLFLIWQSGDQGAQLQQLILPAEVSPSVHLSLEDNSHWHGDIELLAIGINLPPQGQITVESVAISSPSLARTATGLIKDWSSFTPWRAYSINFYTGTQNFNEGTSPTYFFTCVIGLLLGLYLLSLLASGRLRQFDWRVAGGITLACWIALDLLWQVRLARQNVETHATFGGKTAQQKLLASEDAQIFQFITRVKKEITQENARLFLDSAADGTEMRSAYYLAPVNTYWHRKGPELPERKHFLPGDYLLIIEPSLVRYDAATGSVVFHGADDLPVEVVLQEPVGALLQVRGPQ